MLKCSIFEEIDKKKWTRLKEMEEEQKEEKMIFQNFNTLFYSIIINI